MNKKTSIDDSDKSPESKLWRYMDLPQLLVILQRKELHFSNIATFEDKHEGVHNSFGQNDYFDLSNDGKLVRLDARPEDNRALRNTEELKSFMRPLHEASVMGTGVSCWRISNHESFTMWRNYVRSDSGVAIETTVGDLMASIDTAEYYLAYGKMKYINYEASKIPLSPLYMPFFHKRLYFEDEQEFRVICHTVNKKHDQVGLLPENLEAIPIGGVNLGLDVKKLIKRIWISPHAVSWFGGLVRDVVHHSYGLDVEITESVCAKSAGS